MDAQKIPLSVFVIAYNEEVRIGATLEAVADWVDEIVLVDSGSTDRTVAIAHHYLAKIYHKDWTGYGPQKRFGEQCCKNNWLLNIDADEVVTPALANEIRALFQDGQPAPSVYRLPILTVYPGDERPRPFANDYNVVRLYHRDIAGYVDHPVFDRVSYVDQMPKQLRSPIHHFSVFSIQHGIEKTLRYSSFRAGHTKGRSIAIMRLRLAIEFPLSFFKFWIIRRHIFGGWKGFYFSILQSFMRTTRIAKVMERESRN